MQSRVLKYLIAGSILLGAAGYLAYASLKEGWVSYHMAVDAYLADKKFASQRVRLAGKVAEEGINGGAGRMGVEFVLLGEKQKLPVVYKGVVPEMFKAGGEVVVEGRLDQAGTFRAEVMMTKCASKYEAAHDSKHKEKAS
jgi:cytochrome c-type biogenesis protein CcmE